MTALSYRNSYTYRSAFTYQGGVYVPGVTPPTPVGGLNAPSLVAVSMTDAVTGAPVIQLTATNVQIFNLVGPTDASFEDGIGSATVVTNCSLSRSTAFALDGISSLCMTSLANGAMTARLGPYPVVAGTEYSVAAAYHAAHASESCRTDVAWYSTTALISTSTGSASADTSALPWLPETSLPNFTAPSGAMLAYITLNVLGSTGPLAVPSAFTVAPAGPAGSTPYHYEVTGVNLYGETSASTMASTVLGAKTLSATSYNALSWIGSATSFNVYRSPKVTCATIAAQVATCAMLITEFATCAAIPDYAPTPVLIANTTANSYHDTGVAVAGTATPPSVNTTGERHYVDECGLFPGAVSEWSIFTTGAITIMRSDGQYVLGASPLYPLMLSGSGVSIVSIVDRTAPYGLPVSYVAVLDTAGTDNSGPSLPSDVVIMGQAPDTLALLQRIGWAKTQDSTGTLVAWLSALGQMAQVLDNMSYENVDTNEKLAPGWSQVLDINRAPTAALPWLGQFVGVAVDPSQRDDVQRYTIDQEAGFSRGTPAAILAAANKYVRIGQSATIAERDSSAYHLTVTIPVAGTEIIGSCLSLSQSYPTCTAVEDDFATCLDLWQSTGSASAAVLAAIPAGLQVTIAYD